MLRDLIENKATEGLHLVLMKALEAAGKLGDGKELTLNIRLKMTREGNGEYAIDGVSAVQMTQTEKHKIELATWNPDQPDLFESEEKLSTTKAKQAMAMLEKMEAE